MLGRPECDSPAKLQNWLGCLLLDSGVRGVAGRSDRACGGRFSVAQADCGPAVRSAPPDPPVSPTLRARSLAWTGSCQFGCRKRARAPEIGGPLSIWWSKAWSGVNLGAEIMLSTIKLTGSGLAEGQGHALGTRIDTSLPKKEGDAPKRVLKKLRTGPEPGKIQGWEKPRTREEPKPQETLNPGKPRTGAAPYACSVAGASATVPTVLFRTSSTPTIRATPRTRQMTAFCTKPATRKHTKLTAATVIT